MSSKTLPNLPPEVMTTIFEKLPYRKQKEIFINLPLHHLISPSLSQKKLANLKIAKNKIQGWRGARERLLHGETNVNLFVRAIPPYLKKDIFSKTGYRGHSNARSFFSAYDKRQRLPRYLDLIKKGEKNYNISQQNKIKSLYN